MLHSLADLLLYARLSSAAYLLGEEAALEAILKTLELDLVGIVRHRSVEAFVVTGFDRTVLVYQGTRVTENLSPVELWADLDGDPIDLGNGIIVHDGFYTDLKSAWPKISVALPRNGLPLYATGHSLGGSRAHLTPLFIDCHVVSYGAPKVGNAAYWQAPVWWRSTLCRVVREQDFAPGWPKYTLRWPFLSPFRQSTMPFFWMRGGIGSLEDARPGPCLSVPDHSDARYAADLVQMASAASKYAVG